MKLLFRLLLFFTFFESFCIFNVQSAEWGLQVSWFLALVIFLTYPVAQRGKLRLPQGRNFKIVTNFFFTILLVTLCSWGLQRVGIITFPNGIESTVDSEVASATSHLRRSLMHTIYLIFDYLVYFFLVMYLQALKYHDKEVRVFITWTFYFIVMWGVYQWITTFNVVPYAMIFNNSASTGFTYERFAADHRSASVFPEPSGYAIFIAFMAAFVAYQFFSRRREIPVYSRHSYLMVFWWLVAIFTCQSMSLFMVLPIILLYLVSRNVKLSSGLIVVCICGLVALLGLITIVQAERLTLMAAGDDGSILVRFAAFLSSYELFLASPIFGAGFGAIRGLDMLGFVLATTGIVGLAALMWMTFKLKSDSSLNNTFIQGLKAVLIVTSISNPILDTLFFWVILAFITVPLTTKKEYENKLHSGTLQPQPAADRQGH